MFCFQCQETAKGTGCILSGVCGKTPEVANMQDLLLFVVRGIAVYNQALRKDGQMCIRDSYYIVYTSSSYQAYVPPLSLHLPDGENEPYMYS